MFITLVVLSLAGVKNETPQTKKPKLECVYSVKPSVKLEDTTVKTKECITSGVNKSRRVEK
jgi:hypothetical protein